jgi:DNA repair exonuclease SbcCD ATPase subunit
MERLSMKKKVAIVRQYLSGMSYDEIAARTGVSKGTVANVVTELKAGRFPEAADVVDQIELLRELSLDLRRSKLIPSQCATGLIVLTRINECGLDPADIGRWALILKSARTEDEAQELVRMIYSIEEVQKKTGLSLEDLDGKVHKLEKKAADLEPMSRQHEDYRKQLADLNKQRDDLANIVANLDERYKLLNPRVKDLEKREQDLSRRIKDMETRGEKAEITLATLSKERQRLLDAGLSLEALAELRERVQSIAQRHHIAPAELRDRLLQELEKLDQAVGLETLIHSQQQELEKQERAAALGRQEQESLKEVVASLKQEKASLEASIKNTREKVSGEMAKIAPAAMDVINRLEEELRHGHDEALVEVRRLRDETIEVGKEVGRYEQTLQANQWLIELLAMVQGDESIEGKRVRVIVLLALRGAAAWLKRHSSESRTLSSLSSATDSLIRELEQWKV